MIQSLALLFIPFSLFLVVNMEFFGALHITAISVLGGVLSLLGAVILLLLPLPNFEVCVGKVRRVECISFIFSLLVILFYFSHLCLWSAAYLGGDNGRLC